MSTERLYRLVVAVTVLFGLAFIPFSMGVLGVRYSYTVRVVALGGALLGVVSGVLGSFAVLRRQSLMGDALSHAALPGVGIAFLIAGRELGLLLLGAAAASWLGMLFIRAVTSTTRLKEDSAMGIVLASWFAAGIAILAFIQDRPDASQAGLDAFIFGQAASIVAADLVLIASVGAVSFLVLGLFWKELKLYSFDPEFAAVSGFSARFLNLLISTLLVVAIVLGLELAGVVLMVGMLISPGVAARQWTDRLDRMVVLAGVFGAVAGAVGAVLSAAGANLPTGPMIIVTAFGIVMISLLLAPQRGVMWRLLRPYGDHRRYRDPRVSERA